jgi:hypothetical protein
VAKEYVAGMPSSVRTPKHEVVMVPSLERSTPP